MVLAVGFLQSLRRDERFGGAHGLGLVIGKKYLERDHWYFPCHFKGDHRTCYQPGQEFKRFDNSTTSLTRVLSVTNLEKGKFYNVDVNPSKGTMVAQFDVPEDAWFFKANSRDGLMLYSILMEIGLQTSGILTSWVKAPLTMDKDDILFRNLGATAELIKYIDLRGKTITNTSHVVGYSMLGNMGVHRFTFESFYF